MTTQHTDRFSPKPPRASEAFVSDLMMPHQANGLRRPSVFGGVIMSMVDRCAALSAMRHSAGPATTLSIPSVRLTAVVDVPGTAHENGTIVSVIADRHRQVPGVMATIFGTKVRVVSWMVVNACNSTTVIPTTVPTTSRGAEINSSIHVASRPISRMAISFMISFPLRLMRDPQIGMRRISL